MKKHAFLRQGENSNNIVVSTCGKRKISVLIGIPYCFEYDKHDNFYLVVDGFRFEETSTAFDFK